MKAISLLLPTRERVGRTQSFLQSVVETAEQLSAIEVVLAVDDDDHVSKEILSPHPQLRLIKMVGPRCSMGALNTRCLEKASGEIIILVNDDILIRTPGWDRQIIEKAKAFDDGIYLMYPNDGMKTKSYPHFPILSRKFCEQLGDPFPKEYVGDGIDVHLHDIFLRLKDVGMDRFCYLPHVFFEHMHVYNGKADKDRIYQTRVFGEGDRIFYSLWLLREEGIHSICRAFETRECKRRTNKIGALFACFLFSKQSMWYRFKYFVYHCTREFYLLLHLNQVKRWLRQKRVL